MLIFVLLFLSGALIGKYVARAENAKKADHSKYALRALYAKYARFAKHAEHLVKNLPPPGKDAYDLTGTIFFLKSPYQKKK